MTVEEVLKNIKTEIDEYLSFEGLDEEYRNNVQEIIDENFKNLLN